LSNYIDANQAGTLALTISNKASKAIQEFMSTPSVNGILIYPNEYLEVVDSNVSEQMIIDGSGGAIQYFDNIALQPRAWQIKGFIKASIGENTNLFQPSLQVQKYALFQFRNLRQPVQFKDPQQQTFKCFIEKLEFPQQPDTQNALIINISLKEVNVLSVINSSQGATNSATAPAGNASASASNIGTAASAAQGTATSIITSTTTISTTVASTAYVGNVNQANELLKSLSDGSYFNGTYNAVDKKGNAI
jgi:hypothetical protein